MAEISKEQLRYIRRKQKALNEVAAKLKQDFVGLDKIIDKIVDTIKIWYIHPELQIRPTVLCLWGMTGVGKTDLVRKMVSYMSMQDKFLELEMGDTGGDMQAKLESSSLTPEDQCVVFLDEFQRFRTVNPDGSDAKPKGYADVWTLLSDGKFQVDLSRKSEIVDSLLYSRYESDWSRVWEDSDDRREKRENRKKKKEMVYKTPLYTARRVKRMFKLSEPLEDIMRFDEAKLNDLYEQAFKNPKIFEPAPYNKMLIIISGNLDEAYHMSKNVEDTDVDADYYHHASKGITMIHIKKALAVRFKPEQIARLGNSHVIYPCFSNKNYQDIIRMKCRQIGDLIKSLKGITVEYDDEVYQVMYDNGVFPTQGVRPLLSTITDILSSALPKFLFEALKIGQKTIQVTYKDGKLITVINKKKITHHIPTVIDDIKKGIAINMKSRVAVHELGHAFVNCFMYNSPPSEVCANSVSPYVDGFVIQNESLITKLDVQKRIRICLAGIVAEEIVFGPNLRGAGGTNDLEVGTKMARDYICHLGYSDFKYAVEPRPEECETKVYKDHDIISTLIERYISEAYTDLYTLFDTHGHIYKDLLVAFIENDYELEGDDFIRVFNNHGIKLNRNVFGQQLSSDYNGMVMEFLGKEVKVKKDRPKKTAKFVFPEEVARVSNTKRGEGIPEIELDLEEASA